MKIRLGLMLIPLAISLLSCQTVITFFDGGASNQAEVTAVAQPDEAFTSEPSPTATSAAANGNQIDPCSLLTEEQIASVHGEEPGESVRDTHDYVALGPVASCRWPEIRLELSVLVPPPGQDAQAYYQEYIRRMDPWDFPTGLGDEAWGDPQGGEVLVRQGDTYFMLEEHTFDADNYEQNQELAAMVLENLP